MREYTKFRLGPALAMVDLSLRNHFFVPCMKDAVDITLWYVTDKFDTVFRG